MKSSFLLPGRRLPDLTNVAEFFPSVGCFEIVGDTGEFATAIHRLSTVAAMANPPQMGSWKASKRFPITCCGRFGGSIWM